MMMMCIRKSPFSLNRQRKKKDAHAKKKFRDRMRETGQNPVYSDLLFASYEKVLFELLAFSFIPYYVLTVQTMMVHHEQS